MTDIFKQFKSSQMPEAFWHEAKAMQAQNPRYDNPFLNPIFAEMVAKVREDTVFAVSHNAHGLTSFWPMQKGKGNWAQGIGGCFSDRNGPLITPNSSYHPSALLEAHNITGFSSMGLVCPEKIDCHNVNFDAAYITILEDNWDHFLEVQRAQYASFFKRLHRLMRKLNRECGEVEFNFHDTDKAAFEELIAIKRDQFSKTGKHDVLGSEWSKKLLSILWDETSADFGINFSTLKIDGKLVAGEFNLRDRTTLHGWLVAYNMEYRKYLRGLF